MSVNRTTEAYNLIGAVCDEIFTEWSNCDDDELAEVLEEWRNGLTKAMELIEPQLENEFIRN